MVCGRDTACCLGDRSSSHIALRDRSEATLRAVGPCHPQTPANPKRSVRHPPGLHLQQPTGCPLQAPHGGCTPLDALQLCGQELCTPTTQCSSQPRLRTLGCLRLPLDEGKGSEQSVSKHFVKVPASLAICKITGVAAQPSKPLWCACIIF